MWLFKIQTKYLYIVIGLIVFQAVNGQQLSISYSSEGKPLNSVLEEISRNHNVKFAYDSDSFNKIYTNFTISNSTVEQFLKLLETNHFVHSKLIEGTFVLVLKVPEMATEPEPVITPEPQKPKYITVAGFVKDRKTSEDLLYCNVVYGVNKGAMTNDLGYFSFSTRDADTVRILISHLGYIRLDTLISTKGTAALFLVPSEIMMQAIQVTQYEKKVLEASPQPDKIGFNPLKSSNSPRISSDDLANALLLIPGVNFFQGSSSGLSIRGGAPTDNLVFFDGIPVLETSHLLGNMSVLNSKYVQQAFVSRGGFDAEFGERVAGLIELTGKSGKNNKPYLDVSANLLNTNVLANVPVSDKFSITAAWRRSFIDQWQNYLYLRLIDDVSSGNSGGNTVASTIYPTIKYQDVNAKVSFHPTDKLEFNLNILYGTDFQSRDFELFKTKDYYRNELIDSENLGLSFNWNWQINKHWYQSLTAGYSGLQKEIVDETGELEEVTGVVVNPGKGKGKGKGLAKTKEKTFNRLISIFQVVFITSFCRVLNESTAKGILARFGICPMLRG